MIKRELTYENIDGEEVKETVRFHFSVSGMRNYESLTDRKFFEDYGKAFEKLGEVLSGVNVETLDTEEINSNSEEFMMMLKMISDPVINQFVCDYIQAFYARVENGLFVQNEATMDEAGDALWFQSLISIEFFVDLFSDLQKNQKAPKQSKKKVTRIVK